MKLDRVEWVLLTVSAAVWCIPWIVVAFMLLAPSVASSYDNDNYYDIPHKRYVRHARDQQEAVAFNRSQRAKSIRCQTELRSNEPLPMPTGRAVMIRLTCDGRFPTVIVPSGGYASGYDRR